MTELKVDNITNLAGSGKPNLPVQPTVGSNAAISTLNTHEYTSSSTEPSNPKNGALWWDSGNDKVFVYINGEFKEIELNASAAAAFTWGGDRGVVFGVASSYNNILYFNIAGSGGGSANFGNLTLSRSTPSAGGSASRVVMGGGYGDASINSGRSDVIDYITPSSTGNATDFGNLTAGRNALQAVSNGTRCLFASGYTNGQGIGHANWTNAIDYVTIASTGNATSFGSLTTYAINFGGTGAGDGTRGLFMGGIGTTYNYIEYVTYATTGNSANFGDLIHAMDRNSSCSDATRSVSFGGGGGHSPSDKNIEYVTTQTLGNATDFGDLSNAHSSNGSMSNGTIAIAQTGIHMEKVTIQTTGNATDFGDLLESRTGNSASSGSPS